MRLSPRPAAGFSIIELLIALIIISILVAMVILVASQRAGEARLRAAEADLRLIGEAEKSAVTDIGFFLRLYVLDDVVGGDDLFPQLPPDPNDFVDGLQDERGNTRNPEGDIYGIQPDFGSLAVSTGTSPPGDLVDIQARVRNETNVGIGLPYINFPREYIDAFGNNYNVPRDPWGNPYVILTRQGFINDIGSSLFTPVQGQIPRTGTLTVVGFSGSFALDRFDRFTLLSFGPDASPGDGGVGNLGEGDDLIFQLN
jgi:prepilin-type N-terminal cleavage/methylation domain-containing protein